MFRSHFYPGEAHFVALPSHGLILAASSWLEARSWLNLHHSPYLAKKEVLDSDVFPKRCDLGKETDFSRIGHFASENSHAYSIMQDFGTTNYLGARDPKQCGGR